MLYSLAICSCQYAFVSSRRLHPLVALQVNAEAVKAFVKPGTTQSTSGSVAGIQSAASHDGVQRQATPVGTHVPVAHAPVGTHVPASSPPAGAVHVTASPNAVVQPSATSAAGTSPKPLKA